MWAVRFTEETLDDCDRAKSVGHDPWTLISLLLDYCRLIIIRAFTLNHVSIHDSSSARLTRDHRISLLRSTVANYALALMVIKWTTVHEIYALSSSCFDPTHLGRPRHLRKPKRVVSPTQRKLRRLVWHIR